MMDLGALVTGGGGGIGRAIALALARQGAHVAVHCFNGRSAAEEVAAEIRSLGRRSVVVQADLSARALPDNFVAEVVEGVGPVTLLACAAGMCREDMLFSMDMDDWDAHLALNLRGAVLVCQALVPAMARARRGSVVLVGSAVGAQGSPGLSAYAASKAGLEGFARSLAAEVGPRGVRVNVVSPGPIETAMLDAMTEEHKQVLSHRTALGRLGMPAEVADATCFLLSDAARYVTGAVLPVDGGLNVFRA